MADRLEVEVVGRVIERVLFTPTDVPTSVEDCAAACVDALDEWRRRVRRVGPLQCGAPTRAGHPCMLDRVPGSRRCPAHQGV